jgi:hypothetical protein
MESPLLWSTSQISYRIHLIKEDFERKKSAGGPLQDFYRVLCGDQGEKCFLCCGSLAVPGRSRVQRKLRAWVLAQSDLPGEEICRLANDRSNFVVVHTTCVRGMRDMRRRFFTGNAIPSSSSSNAKICSTDTNTPEVMAPRPIEGVARDPLRNP